MTEKWRISELQTAVELALDAGSYNGQTSGRVRVVPNTRAIRYYTTLGLVDRAGSMVGRTAYYGKRHVMQLVAIKRMQAAGKSLTEIQTELTGVTSRKLSGLAGLPADFWKDVDSRIESIRAAGGKLETATDVVARKRMAAPAPLPDASSTDGGQQLQSARDAKSKVRPDPKVEIKTERAFWAQSPVTPVARDTDASLADGNDDAGQINIRHETRIEFPDGVTISIPAAEAEIDTTLLNNLKPAVQEILNQLKEAGLIKNEAIDNSKHNEPENGRGETQ